MDNRSVILSNGECSQDSLMSALNKFVHAVDSMDVTVMIPNRLKDMEVTASNIPVVAEENNNKALLPTVKQGTDLYSFYSLLKTVKTDLTVGPHRVQSAVLGDTEEAPEGELENTHTEESAKKTAAAFRHHLSGIFRLLHQMTDTANYLTNRYESEVGGKSSQSPSLAPFAI
ncbi:mid1-interacting protein 1-B-like [Mizuhopecten yessoensis]|uniref:Mid1-interacting protein 1-like n=1 Tax=Mizuhopecten yessoensis TaxID=6573 RepID=A0A210PIS4_MIZYE|nr:mid1-interacting protein 1-B-like [Mizuhopecten yessoensis]OWF36398.1 Mid1-interacting protein 1-like [Mizuhopecten yessoensis]